MKTESKNARCQPAGCRPGAGRFVEVHSTAGLCHPSPGHLEEVNIVSQYEVWNEVSLGIAH